MSVWFPATCGNPAALTVLLGLLEKSRLHDCDLEFWRIKRPYCMGNWKYWLENSKPCLLEFNAAMSDCKTNSGGHFQHLL